VLEAKISERKTIVLLSLFGSLVAILTVRITQQGDMGTFLTVAGLVSKGYKLYAETFEVKDPGFFYSTAIALKWFGIRGPFILDALLILASAPIAYSLLRKFQCHQYVALVASMMFTLTLTGFYYESFRTQIAAILLFLVASHFVLNSKFMLAGIALFLMITFKFGFIIFSPVVLFLIFKRQARVNFHDLTKFFLGFISSLILFFGIMAYRGEFLGYLECIGDNFNYAKIAQETYGLPIGLLGHLEIWNNLTNNSGWIFITELIFLVTLCIKNRELLRNLHYFTLATNFVILAFLGTSLLWGHHLQILSLSILLNIACISDLLISRLSSNSRDRTSDLKIVLLISFLILTIFTASSVHGTKIPLHKLQSIDNLLHPATFIPPEIELLESFSENSIRDQKIIVARLGGIDDLGYGYFLDTDKYKFACTKHFIIGIENTKQMDRYITCLSNIPSYITVGPYFAEGNPFNPVYQSGRKQIQNLLRYSFYKVSSQGGYDIYQRQ
jgi:hypothetical protein